MSRRDDPAPRSWPQRILVPIEADARTAAALVDHAGALAAALHAELVLLGVKPELAPAAVPPGPPLGPSRADDEALVERRVRDRLADVEARVPSGVRSRAVLGRAPVGLAIVDAAREQMADLVVVPMRRGGEVSHLLHDGADRHVLHHSPVPVLVVPGR